METFMKKWMQEWEKKWGDSRLIRFIGTSKRLFFAMAAVVVFVTTYALILPAITLVKDKADPAPGIVLDGDREGTALRSAGEDEGAEDGKWQFEEELDGKIQIQVAMPDGGLPDGVEMKVEEADLGIDLENAILAAAIQEVDAKQDRVRVVKAMDISFWEEDTEVEPTEEIQVAFSSGSFSALRVPVVVHLLQEEPDEDGNYEVEVLVPIDKEDLDEEDQELEGVVFYRPVNEEAIKVSEEDLEEIVESAEAEEDEIRASGESTAETAAASPATDAGAPVAGGGTASGGAGAASSGSGAGAAESNADAGNADTEESDAVAESAPGAGDAPAAESASAMENAFGSESASASGSRGNGNTESAKTSDSGTSGADGTGSANAGSDTSGSGAPASAATDSGESGSDTGSADNADKSGAEDASTSGSRGSGNTESAKTSDSGTSGADGSANAGSDTSGSGAPASAATDSGESGSDAGSADNADKSGSEDVSTSGSRGSGNTESAKTSDSGMSGADGTGSANAGSDTSGDGTPASAATGSGESGSDAGSADNADKSGAESASTSGSRGSGNTESAKTSDSGTSGADGSANAGSDTSGDGTPASAATDSGESGSDAGSADNADKSGAESASEDKAENGSGSGSPADVSSGSSGHRSGNGSSSNSGSSGNGGSSSSDNSSSSSTDSGSGSSDKSGSGSDNSGSSSNRGSSESGSSNSGSGSSSNSGSSDNSSSSSSDNSGSSSSNSGSGSGSSDKGSNSGSSSNDSSSDSNSDSGASSGSDNSSSSNSGSSDNSNSNSGSSSSSSSDNSDKSSSGSSNSSSSTDPSGSSSSSSDNSGSGNDSSSFAHSGSGSDNSGISSSSSSSSSSSNTSGSSTSNTNSGNSSSASSSSSASDNSSGGTGSSSTSTRSRANSRSKRTEDLREIRFNASQFSVYCLVETETIVRNIEVGERESYTLTTEGDGYFVKLRYTSKAAIPEGAELVVSEIGEGTEEYEEYYAQAQAQMLATATASNVQKQVSSARFFDITIYDAEGEKIEPKAPVEVQIFYDDSFSEDNDNISMIHFGENKTEVIESEIRASSRVEEDEEEYLSEDEEDGLYDAGLESSSGETGGGAISYAASAYTGISVEEDALTFVSDSFSVYGVIETYFISTDYLSADGENYRISVSYGPEAGIPEGAWLSAREIPDASEEYLAYAEKAGEAIGEGERLDYARFFDIRILDMGGEKVEIAAPVEVEISLADKADASGNAGNSKQGDAALPAYGGAGTDIPEDGAAGKAQVIHFESLPGGEVPEALEGVEENGGAVSFETDSFSVFAVVYTVDFSYSVDGELYGYSLPGGGFISFTDLVKVLGIANGTDPGDASAFVANVESITFSDPQLVWVGKAEEDTTVGALKDGHGLSCEYSAELTEEEIAEINGTNVSAGDWALISLKPFDSEESLAVTMKNGEQFVVKVTDAASKYIITRILKDGTAISFTSGSTVSVTGTAWNNTKNHTWTSNDTSVVTVSESGNPATFTAKGAGTTTVTHKGIKSNGKNESGSETYTVTVEAKASEKEAAIELAESSASLAAGEEKQIDIKSSEGTLSVSSSDETIVTAAITSGKVVLTGLNAGTAEVTVTAASGSSTKTAKITVTVTAGEDTATLSETTQGSNITVSVKGNTSILKDKKLVVNVLDKDASDNQEIYNDMISKVGKEIGKDLSEEGFIYFRMYDIHLEENGDPYEPSDTDHINFIVTITDPEAPANGSVYAGHYSDGGVLKELATSANDSAIGIKQIKLSGNSITLHIKDFSKFAAGSVPSGDISVDWPSALSTSIGGTASATVTGSGAFKYEVLATNAKVAQITDMKMESGIGSDYGTSGSFNIKTLGYGEIAFTLKAYDTSDNLISLSTKTYTVTSSSGGSGSSALDLGTPTFTADTTTQTGKNAWQIVDAGGMNTYGDKIRTSKTVTSTDVENEFKVKLSIDVNASQLLSKLIQGGTFIYGSNKSTTIGKTSETDSKIEAGKADSCADEGDESNYEYFTPFPEKNGQYYNGWMVQKPHVCPVNLKINFPDGSSTTVILYSHEGNFNNGRIYLRIGYNSSDVGIWACLSFMGKRHTEADTTYYEATLTQEQVNLIISGFADTAIGTVTDLMGPNIVCTDHLSYTTGTASYTENSVTWDPVLKAGTKPVNNWYHVGDLTYTVKLDPTESTGLMTPGNQLPGENKNAYGSTLTNQSATLAYAVTDGAGDTVYRDVAFPEPYVRGMLYEIKGTKVDKDDGSKKLSGAAFTLYSDSACKNVVTTSTTGADGEFDFSKLQWGTYYLKETKVPNGYKQNNEVKPITVCYTTNKSDLTGQGVGEEALYKTAEEMKIEDEPAKITVTKVWDDDNNKNHTRPDPEQVTVQLKRNNDDYGDPVTLQADSDGSKNWKHTWSGLPQKDDGGINYAYTVVESPVPTGYTATVTSSGVAEFYAGTGDLEITLTNKPIEYTVRITKVDQTNNTLKGAALSVSGLNPGEEILTEAQIQSIKNTGTADLTSGQLPLDTAYTISESEAPDGYNLIPAPISFKLLADHNVNGGYKLTDGDGKDMPGDSKLKLSVDDSSGKLVLDLRLTNDTGYELPSTGGRGTFSYTLGGLALLAAAALMYGFKIRRGGKRAGILETDTI